MKKIIQKLSVLACVIFISMPHSSIAAPLNGKVLLAKGVVSATDEGGASRLLAKGQIVAKGDKVTTAQKSFVVIKMEDNTKITLRPESSVVIGEFDDEKGKEKAHLKLLKGGLRTVTGLIGKTNPDAVKLSTSVATIGIRGTDYIARLCGGDCLREERSFTDIDYIDVDSPTLGSEINETLPFGLYFLVKEGRIYVQQCPDGTEADDVASCPQVELSTNQSGYAGAEKLGITPRVPLFLENDPHVKFSDIPDESLDALDVLQDEQSDALQCEISDV